jgi:hypothetical protein
MTVPPVTDAAERDRIVVWLRELAATERLMGAAVLREAADLLAGEQTMTRGELEAVIRRELGLATAAVIRPVDFPRGMTAHLNAAVDAILAAADAYMLEQATTRRKDRT